MERTLTSQEETNRALRQSLEGYRQSSTATRPRRSAPPGWCRPPSTTSRAAGEGQMEAARALLAPPTGATAATEPFTQMMQAWTDAFTRFSGGGTADPRSS
jgi:hypothetical protein